MKKLFSLLMVCSVCEFIIAQNEDVPFKADFLNFYSTEGTGSRVDIYIDIPLSGLEFKRSRSDKSLYISKLDLSIEVFNESGVSVYSNISQEEISTKNIKQSYLSLNSQIITRNIFLQPGKYKFILSISEHNKKKKSEQTSLVTVHDFISMPLAMSDVMIVSGLSWSGSALRITPDPARNTGRLDTFYIFCLLYNNSAEELIAVDLLISGKDGKAVFTKKEIFDVSDVLQKQILLAVPTSEFPYGKYTLELTAKGINNSYSTKSYFEHSNPDIPFEITDLNELIDQLQYIARDDEIKYIKKGKDDTEKLKRFLEFWKKKDPSPDTRVNEALIDYYSRIMKADKLFSTNYTRGWRTDMGMVYVIFGEPSNIRRYPYEMDSKPYEIWDYYDLNRSFVFVDNSGFGDYRLVTPIWEIYRFDY